MHRQRQAEIAKRRGLFEHDGRIQQVGAGTAIHLRHGRAQNAYGAGRGKHPMIESALLLPTLPIGFCFTLQKNGAPPRGKDRDPPKTILA